MSPFTPKDWENTPSTATPITAAALEDLETRVTDYTDTELATVAADVETLQDDVHALQVITGEPVVLGNDAVGASSGALTINHSTVIAVSIASSGTATIEVWIAGDGGTPGSIGVRGVIYEGVDSSSALLATGTPATVNSGDTGAWVTVGENLSVTAGTLYFGFHVGGTNGVATSRYETAASGASYWNSDTYSDGSSATFGTPNADTRAYSIRVTFTPDLLDYSDEIAALEAQVTGLEADVAELQTAGSGVISTLVDSGTLEAGESSIGPLIDLGATTAVGFTVASTIATGGTGDLTIEDHDGSTTRVRALGAAASTGSDHVASATAMTLNRYVRASYENGGSPVTGFELILGYSATV